MKNTFLTEHFSVTGSKSFKNNSLYIVPLMAASELFIEYLWTATYFYLMQNYCNI